MKLICDRDADIVLLVLKETPVEESDEVREGIIHDYDAQGDVVAVEIRDASRRIVQPEGIEFQLAK